MLVLFSAFCVAKKKNEKKQVEYIGEDTRQKLFTNFSSAELSQITQDSEPHEYQAEITRVLNILIDSIYHNKDIFLRELISNANDALDKIRFQAIRNPAVLEGGPSQLEILIDVNEEEKTISITDTGIGMTKEELVENLGRVAKSGTRDFQEAISSGDTNLIGQFGVGFYSAFLVSDRVTVISKSNNDTKQWIWTSTSPSSFNIAEDPRGNTLGRGTSIICHLKDNEYSYVDRDRIVQIVRHYSMFVDFPVKMWHFTDTYVEAEKQRKVKDDIDDIFGDNDVVEERSDDDDNVSDSNGDDGEDEFGLVKKTIWTWVQVNDRKPIWLRDPKDVAESDYTEFFTMFFKEPKGPMLHAHFKQEGHVIFHGLFFIPSVPPPSDSLFQHVTRNVRLYVKRILIADEWGDELLPDYLHFVKGVIDSNDLTLNVDRDRLVKLGALKMIKKRVTTKVLSMIRNMYMNDPIQFADFYSKYSGNIKYGVCTDELNRKMLSKLLMFFTSYSPKKLTTLDDYIARMKKGQEKIYWIGASSLEEACQSPYKEGLLAKGHEVIYAIEPIDIHCLEKMDEFNGIPLENPERPDEKVDDKVQDVKGFNLTQRQFNNYVKWWKNRIGDHLETVILTKRLITTPAICSATTYGYTASHERLLRSQTVHDKSLSENLFMNKKVLELNFDHPSVQALLARIRRAPRDEAVIEDARLLFDTALLAGGFTLVDARNYTRRIYHMLGRSYGVGPEVKQFETENKVYKPLVEDSIDARMKGVPFVHLSPKGNKSHTIPTPLRPDGDEERADIEPATNPESFQGIL